MQLFINMIKDLFQAFLSSRGTEGTTLPVEPTEPLDEAKNALKSDEYIYWKKGELKHLSQHILSSEVECRRCDLGSVQKISKDLLNRFEQVRTDFGHPIRITSAYRCSAHNKIIGGAKNSQHIFGNALDIQPQTFSSAAQLERLFSSCEKYFSSIGDARKRSPSLPSNFVHVDTRSDKRRWIY